MAEPDIQTAGHYTHADIWQQPEIWPDTVRRAIAATIHKEQPAILTGEGTTAYGAQAAEAAWPGSRAVASTELFLEFSQYLDDTALVVSFARSGDSAESRAVVDKVRQALPRVRHLAITCNTQGKLATAPGVETLVLDPRTNDRSLAMTSSFSSLALAGIAAAQPREAQAAVPVMSGDTAKAPPELEKRARQVAANPPRRAVVLTSGPLFGAAREAHLKILEMTAGRVAHGRNVPRPSPRSHELRRAGHAGAVPDLLVALAPPLRVRFRCGTALQRTGPVGGAGARRWCCRSVRRGDLHAAFGSARRSAHALRNRVRATAGLPPEPEAGFQSRQTQPGVINRVVAGVRIYED